MADILISWLGTADINGCDQDPVLGPLASTLRFHTFDRAYVLHNQPESLVRPVFHTLVENFSTEIIFCAVDIQSPIHFGDIYKALDTALSRAVEENPSAQLNIQLTSGTPAMTSVSILTGKTKYKVKFLQSSLEQGVQFVDIPFDIAADFLPSVSNVLDKQLTNLIANGAPSTAAFDNIVTQDLLMKRLIQRAAILAIREVPVLIHGETGTGKELFARAIHNSSNRSEESFLSINCGAIPSGLMDSTLFGHAKGAFTGATSDRKGVFAEANGGTLFLDEFGELPLEAQVRLLRVLQDGTYLPVGATKELFTDVRIIVATNRNLPKEIAKGRFREDLFYRVAIGVIDLPPLRSRQGDKWLLAEHLLEQINNEAANQPCYINKKISPGAKKIILNHSWPGNIRELHAALLRGSLWGASANISESDMKEAMLTLNPKEEGVLGKDISQGVDIIEIIRDVSVHYIERALIESSGSKTKAAELLSLKNYQTLNNWMEKYGISQR